MSDSMRKDLSSKAEETVTPDSQKSYLDQAKEQATDAGDKVARNVQPSGDKSIAQQASDSTSSALGGKPGEKPLIEQVQDAATDAYNTVSKAAADTYNSVVEGGKK